jgi:hypothetical protein
VFEDDALKPEAPLLPAVPLLVDVADPLDEPAETDPVENDPVGKDDVGTLSGSEPVAMLPVWSLAV